MREFMTSTELIQALASPDHKVTLADLQFLYYQGLVERAHQSAYAAAATVVPTPMIVAQHANPMDDTSPVTKAWRVDDGVCGFAWVTIQRNGPFWKWAKDHCDLFRSRAETGGKGAVYWISYFNQSLTRKEAYASEFARVLREGGISAYSDSRLD